MRGASFCAMELRRAAVSGATWPARLAGAVRSAFALGAVAVAAACGGGDQQTIMMPPPTPPPVIVTPSVAGGMVTFPYSQTIQANSGAAPYTWSVSSGKLPQNLSLTNAFGELIDISGTPQTAETQTFTLQVKDTAGMTASKAFTIEVKSLTPVQVQEVAGAAPFDMIEIQGLAAGAFNPSDWLQHRLNWVPDVRVPMLAPQPTGAFQNIYAPWALEQQGGWRLFYGGWDGTDTGNDRIWSGTTADFLSFAGRHLVIDHGSLNHVNNANIHQLPDGTLHMLFGFQAIPNGLDQIAYTSSPDGTSWNGTPEPYTAQISDAVTVQGDPTFAGSDFNGGNVLFRESASWTMYYSGGQFGKKKGNVYRATSTSLPAFTATGTALGSINYANDVKKFLVQGQNWYVMALYYEPVVFGEPPASFVYSLSRDGVTFSGELGLFGGAGAADKFVTTPSFVTQNGRILGVLYGGDAVDWLDPDYSIFARWLQKKVVIEVLSGASGPPSGAYGPDRQWFYAPAGGSLQGTMTVFAEDGSTPLATGPVSLSAGKSYQFVAP